MKTKREEQMYKDWEENIANAYDEEDDDTVFSAFIDGAKWTDRHPNPDTIKSIFEFALNNTNFLIADSLESIDWGELVKRAMKE